MVSERKKLLVWACIASMLSLPALLLAQSVQGPAITASQSEVKQRLLLEAQRVELPSFLDSSSTSPEAIELARQLSVLARDLQIAWLKRGLGDLPIPNDMVDRLSREASLHRKKIIADLGRIATQTLTEAALPIKKDLRRDLPATSHAREARSPGPINPDKFEEFVGPHCSPRFGFIEQHSCERPCLLTVDQLTLSWRLDDTARSCLAYWGKKQLIAAEVAQGLLDHARRLRHSLVDLTDSILFHTILDPGQVEKFWRAYWISRGTNGLLEPEMVSHLGISKGQRGMIKAALDGKMDQAIKLRKLTPRFPSNPTLAEREQAGAEWGEIYYRQQAEVDQAIWDMLTPSQISKINKFLGDKASRPGRARQEGSSKRPALSSY